MLEPLLLEPLSLEPLPLEPLLLWSPTFPRFPELDEPFIPPLDELEPEDPLIPPRDDELPTPLSPWFPRSVRLPSEPVLPSLSLWLSDGLLLPAAE